MNNATLDSDPTLLALVPQRSKRRNALLVVIALAVLAGLAFSPPLFQPSISSDAGGRTWSALGTQRQVIVRTTLDPSAWPFATVQSVADVAGASVAGAWLIDDPPPDSERPISDDSRSGQTGLEVIQAEFPSSDVGPTTQLPQRVSSGDSMQLIVLWDIIACGALDEETPTVELRTAIGTTTIDRLDAAMSPGRHYDTLVLAGICD